MKSYHIFIEYLQGTGLICTPLFNPVTTYEAVIIIIFILQVGKPRHREVK